MHTMILTLAPLGFVPGFGLSVLHKLLTNREDDES